VCIYDDNLSQFSFVQFYLSWNRYSLSLTSKSSYYYNSCNSIISTQTNKIMLNEVTVLLELINFWTFLYTLLCRTFCCAVSCCYLPPSLTRISYYLSSSAILKKNCFSEEKILTQLPLAFCQVLSWSFTEYLLGKTNCVVTFELSSFSTFQLFKPNLIE
jgi:hypothetical protein